jgi:sirohydrochlorin cobaltochelatase
MGHGTHHPANAAYPAIQRVFDDLKMPVYVGTVEGYPSLDGVIALLEREGIKKVTLYPLMLVAGDMRTTTWPGTSRTLGNPS